MQTEANSEESEMLNAELNTLQKLKNVELKKTPLFLPPKVTKGEPRDDDQSIPEIPSKKSKPVTATNGDKNEDLLNGESDILGPFSDDDSEHFSKPNEKQVSNSLKKEELTEVKILDEAEEMLLNEDDDLFSNGSNEQFSFNLNTNDQLQGEFLDDNHVENPLAECESEVGDGNEITEARTNEENEANDSSADANDDEDDGTAQKESGDNDDCDNLQNAESNENLSEDHESNADEDANSKGETSANVSESNDSVETEKNTESGTNDEVDKDAELDTQENKRPLSRESTTSTTSSCSERTLTIRSASDLNKLVMSANDALVKKEKISQDSTSEVEPVPEKPHGGLSILNPSQLGASISGGENFLQNMNFAQPNDQMNVMGYMQNNTVPLQCDVCETQFPDNILLEEHKANAGHYKCHATPDCAAIIFQSMAEVSTHHQTVHNVLQQLTHQVQTLPIRYQMDPLNNNYPSMTQFQSTSPQPTRAVVPQVYPPAQNNMQMRGYNAQPQPRFQIGSVRGNVAMPIQSTNAVKRSSATLPQPRMTPPKRGRVDYSRNGDTDCKVVSIQKPDNTDDVVAQLSKSITITARQDSQKKNDAAAVTNLLANRGITVSSVPAKQNRNSSAVTALSLNSAVSLIPTNGANNKQGRTNARPAAPVVGGRLQTVDLTGPDPPRNRQINRNNRFQCQICDRNFFNQDQLNQHMITHRNVARKQLPFKCNLCTAQYPTQQGLQQHKQTFHRDSVSSTNEMVIPIVDLKQPGSFQKLNAIGIHHMIPLNALGSQSANGTFGIPVLPLSSDRNIASNLANCAITNILPVGPLKTLGR